MRREIVTEGGSIVLSCESDGVVVLHTPARRPAVMSLYEARQLGQALLIAAAETEASDEDESEEDTASIEPRQLSTNGIGQPGSDELAWKALESVQRNAGGSIPTHNFIWDLIVGRPPEYLARKMADKVLHERGLAEIFEGRAESSRHRGNALAEIVSRIARLEADPISIAHAAAVVTASLSLGDDCPSLVDRSLADLWEDFHSERPEVAAWIAQALGNLERQV